MWQLCLLFTFCFNVWQKSKHGGLPADPNLTQNISSNISVLNTLSASNVTFVKIPQFYLGFIEDSPIHPTFGEIQCQTLKDCWYWSFSPFLWDKNASKAGGRWGLDGPQTVPTRHLISASLQVPGCPEPFSSAKITLVMGYLETELTKVFLLDAIALK